MRISIFLIALASLQTFALTNYAQTKKFDLKIEQASIVSVLEKIEDETEFFFFYNNQVVNLDKKITVDLKDKSINDVLDEVFKNTSIQYTVNNRQIILSVNGNENQLNQQHKSVSGKVTDTADGSLPGVSVIVKGTTTGVITDGDGKYSLSKLPENATLVFSFVGMKSQEIVVGGKSVINIVLLEETIGVDEVVVIGYGTTKKSDLTGSVSSISVKDLGDRQGTSLTSLIQGKASGVDVSQGKIRIRGVTTFNGTDPLWVIDGFIGGNENTVNPNDIESIEVLKDASSTAIYGTLGANGVILVTTKKGKEGSLKTTINAYTGFSITPKKLDVMNASQYIDYMTDAFGNAKLPLAPKLLTPAVRTDVTKWQDELFKTGQTKEVHVGLSGGSKKANYYFSVGYNSKKGIIVGDQASNKLFIKSVNEFKLKEWITVGTNISANYEHYTGNTPYQQYQFIIMPPYSPVYDSNNSWGYANVDRNIDLSGAENGVTIAKSFHNDGSNLNFQANAYAEIKPLKGLVYRFQSGYGGYYSRGISYRDFFMSGQAPHNNGTSEVAYYGLKPIMENYLTYAGIWGKHNFSIMAGTSLSQNAFRGGMGISGDILPNTEVLNVFNAVSRSIYDQQRIESAFLSYYGRLNYQFNNKYLLTANFRRDGSPKFAPQNRWANFPSLSLAWKLHEENFIKQLSVFDQLKLRAGWGISGNDQIGDFMYLSKAHTLGVYLPLGSNQNFAPGATVRNNSSQDIKWESTESKNVAVDMSFFKNRLDLTVEVFEKNTKDILFTVPRPASMGYGGDYGGDAIINAASVSNKGFEVQLGFKGVVKDFTYSVQGNYTHVLNNVTSLGLGQPYLSGISRTITGQPIGYFYGFIADGIFKTKAEIDAANGSARVAYKAKNPTATQDQLSNVYYQESTTAAGDVKFRDVDNDGTVTWDKDRTKIGNSIPKHLLGLNLTLNYKNLDLNVQFQGNAGSNIYLGEYEYTRAGTFNGNQETYVLDRWRSESQPGNGIVPRAIIGDPANNNRTSTLRVKSADYIRMRLFSIGYNFQSNLINKMGLSQLRAYVSAENWITISKYDGFYDPEAGGSNNNLSRGVDYLGFPTPKSMVFGIQVGL